MAATKVTHRGWSVAVEVGFEPTEGLRLHTLSRTAPAVTTGHKRTSPGPGQSRQDLTYALRLGRAGVEVEFHLRPGVPHMFDMLAPASDVARRAIADRARVLACL